LMKEEEETKDWHLAGHQLGLRGAVHT